MAQSTAATLQQTQRRVPFAVRLVKGLRPRVVPEGAMLAMILFLIASFVITSVSPFDPLKGSPRDRLMGPTMGWQFWDVHFFGTDQNGRDVFARVIMGARYSFTVAAIAVTVAGAIGLTVGMVSGFFGGKIDSILMRVVDTVLAFPGIFLILLLASTFGPSLMLVSLALGATLWAFYARMIRGETLAIRNRDFIKLARISGASNMRLIMKHVLPHVLSTFIVLVSLQVGGAILAEAGLSFIGAGIPPPAPAWGGMAASGRNYIQTAWWVSVFPGLAIVLVVLSFNLVGDWLRDKLDPRYQ